MSEEFFDEMAGKAAKMKALAKDLRDIQDENRQFPEDATLEMKTVAFQYVSRLKTMGYRAEHNSAPDAVVVKLTWANDQGVAFRAGRHPNTDLLAYSSKAEPRISYAATQVADETFNRRDWSVQHYEETLQNFVRGFTEEAMNHGGI